MLPRACNFIIRRHFQVYSSSVSLLLVLVDGLFIPALYHPSRVLLRTRHIPLPDVLYRPGGADEREHVPIRSQERKLSTPERYRKRIQTHQRLLTGFLLNLHNYACSGLRCYVP
jgi:hypothetical protein